MQGPKDARVARVERPSPAPEDIRAQLERLIANPEFPNTGHAHAFLRYVVEETLAGRAERIKGYSVAIEVFNRGEGFTQDDPVVRIEAGRLRRALERYYLVAGQNDPVRIDIPKGKYVPLFTWVGPVVADPAEPKLQLPPRHSRWHITRLVPLALMGLFAVAITGYWIIGRPATGPSVRTNAPGPAVPTLVVAPFANLGEGPEANLYALGLTEELLTALPRFKELQVFGRETSESLPPEVDASHIRGKLGANYLLAGGVRVAEGRIRVTTRLLDTATGAILWSQTYDDDLRSRGLFAIQSDVADKVAKSVAQPYGIIAQADATNPPPDDLDAYGCTLRFYAYRAELSVERHAEVRECLESAVARYPSYATAWAMLSIVYLDEGRFEYNPRAGTPAPLERSLKAARRSVELDPGNARALQALMTVLFFNQQLAESMRIGERALATNPNDTELMGEYGVRLAMGGEWKRGAKVLDQALAFNPGGAGYYHGNRALAAYMLGDFETAVVEIRQANLQKFPLFHLVAAIIYAERGMTAEAQDAASTFVAMRPAFLPNLQAELNIRNIRAEDQARLMAGIRKAGLAIPAGTAVLPGG
ncbi:adenylate cyclase [Phyllobacterium endophyticum]|uniref:Adenylate cyclase n=1 Tax=Phyllobacterium endophyticum TaxID=1149773 RepID=A0A2P7AR86_9HYPH|nr:adenylate cyclase [Phyllobacterium endophyticum]MBB3237408.1 TolB-like protein [Phyllobacterium endophyticum]PSH56744.1 adenylate cyclase [Phyllobacterium endophyticum]TYR44273.1 adenylate cyclase [Phyllobacterium endophyticum]